MEWRPIKGFEDTYLVSDSGKIKRVGKRKYLRESHNSRGYCKVSLSLKGRVTTMLVHRIVAIAFHENPKNKETVNHKDTDKENNRAVNLEWMTNLDNTQHAVDNGCYDDWRNKKKKPKTRKAKEKVLPRDFSLRNQGKISKAFGQELLEKMLSELTKLFRSDSKLILEDSDPFPVIKTESFEFYHYQTTLGRFYNLAYKKTLL